MTTAQSVEKTINDNSTTYYIALVLKCFAVAIPHSFLTLIFMGKGYTVSQIAVIQAFYSVAIVTLEFPSGVLSEKYNKKMIYVLSCVFLIASYVVVLLTSNFYLIVLAWFLYGISSAFETGSIDAAIIYLIKTELDEEKQKKVLSGFIGKETSYSSLSAILGAVIGFFLYKKLFSNHNNFERRFYFG